jgi:hypothetical protein
MKTVAQRVLTASLCAAALLVHAQSTGPKGQSSGQSTQVHRATELRADKLPSAAVLSQLSAGTGVVLKNLEGGWAQVEATDSTGRPLSGWVRAGALSLQAGAAQASTLANGRMGATSTAMSLGVRSLPPRDNRHALIIGIGKYADERIPNLPGTHIDRESATQMARAMQVPTANITYLQDEQATGEGIRKALAGLNDRVAEGDRVFIHYSGHGTRFNDPQAGGCVEALLAHDGGPQGTVTNREVAQLLKPITNKTDKLFVMYDACHSGGVIQSSSTVRTRGFSNANDDGLLRPKFASISEECGRPVNIKGRNLAIEQVAQGALPQDIIHVSASRDNEVSFDDEQKGGLATQFMRDCMLRDALDLDGSGAITMDEIRMCAQEKLNKRMQNDAHYKPHNITMNGNASFVPAWFAQALPVAAVPVVAALTTPTVATIASTVASAPAASVPPNSTVNPAPAVSAAPAALTGEQALKQMFDQRDAKRSVQVKLNKDKLRIGQDALDMVVQSDRAGYVSVAMAGSDNRSLYMLFPNDLDKDNAIAAGKPIMLPRPNWRVKAGGPAGIDSLLVMVSDSPRDLSALSTKPGASKAGPFVTSLNDAQGRAQLGELLINGKSAGATECGRNDARRAPKQCSDAYGAALFTVLEQN